MVLIVALRKFIYIQPFIEKLNRELNPWHHYYRFFYVLVDRHSFCTIVGGEGEVREQLSQTASQPTLYRSSNYISRVCKEYQQLLIYLTIIMLCIYIYNRLASIPSSSSPLPSPSPSSSIIRNRTTQPSQQQSLPQNL